MAGYGDHSQIVFPPSLRVAYLCLSQPQHYGLLFFLTNPHPPVPVFQVRILISFFNHYHTNTKHLYPKTIASQLLPRCYPLLHWPAAQPITLQQQRDWYRDLCLSTYIPNPPPLQLHIHTKCVLGKSPSREAPTERHSDPSPLNDKLGLLEASEIQYSGLQQKWRLASLGGNIFLKHFVGQIEYSLEQKGRI